MSTWQVEKNIFENQPLEMKRQLYSNYVTLDQIEVWRKQLLTVPLREERDCDIYAMGEFRRRHDLDEVLSKKISIWNGDITELEIDAIVNPANSKFTTVEEGINADIHKAAGKYLLEECDDIGGCSAGDARMSGGYNMPAKSIIHTVPPMDKSHKTLIRCYKNSLALVQANRFKSVAFPCIGTGVHGFPNLDAAHIALSETRLFLEQDFLEEEGRMERVIFCVFDPIDEAIYKSAAQLYFANII